VAVVALEHQDSLAQVVLAVLAISLLAVLAHQAQEHLLVAVEVAQEWLALAQTHLLTTAATAVQAVAVAVALLLVVLLVQAVTELFIFTTKE
jgi:hypothetical protein